MASLSVNFGLMMSLSRLADRVRVSRRTGSYETSFSKEFFSYLTSSFSIGFLDMGLKWTSNSRLYPRTILPRRVLNHCLSSEPGQLVLWAEVSKVHIL